MSVSFLLNVHAPSSWQLQSIAIQGEVEGGHTTSGGVADPHRLPLVLPRICIRQHISTEIKLGDKMMQLKSNLQTESGRYSDICREREQHLSHDGSPLQSRRFLRI